MASHRRWAKILAITILLFSIISLEAADLRVVPAEPPLVELRKQADAAIIVLLCKPNAAGTRLEVSAVLKGQMDYEVIKDRIAEFLPGSDTKALSTDGFRELVFIGLQAGQNNFRFSGSVALWPQHDDIVGDHKIRFLAHELKDVKRVIQESNKKAKQAVPSDEHKPSSHVPSDGPTAPADAH